MDHIIWYTVLSVYMVMWFSREHASQKPSKRYYEALNASYVHRMANFEQTKYTFKMTSQTEVGFQTAHSQSESSINLETFLSQINIR